MDWQIKVQYAGKPHILQGETVYASAQIMRIKVYGKKDYILLENDYPFIQSTGSKKAVKWKVKKGASPNQFTPEEAQLIASIISELDYQVKGKHNRINHAEYLQQNKW